MENYKDPYYVEAIIKKESPDPSFDTQYEWLLLRVENNDEDEALQIAQKYLDKSYNGSYQGGVLINLSVLKIVAINPAIENESEKTEVMEVYSVPFISTEDFEKWRDSYHNKFK
jgi:hypothetical protein